MIPYLHHRDISSTEALAEALGRPVTEHEGLTDHTVVAYRSRLYHYTLDDEHRSWTSAEWAEHLDDPNWEHPFTSSMTGDRRSLFHVTVRLHPGDRTLTPDEWSYVAHRLARTTGIAPPGDEQACRWVAVQAGPGRLDLLANLIRLDGTWTAQPQQLHALLAQECQRIEADLRLIPARRDREAPDASSTAAQIAQLLHQLTHETSGPLATVRGLVEHTAYRLAGLPEPYGADAGHRLEWAARRLYSLQQDLDTTAATLTGTTHSAAVDHRVHAAPPAVPARRAR